MKRVPLLIAAALAATGVALALAVGGSAQPPQGGTTIALVEREGPSRNIDNPPRKEFSQGDEFVFQSKLSDPATGDRAGNDSGYCVIARLEGHTATGQCAATVFLSDGTIALEGGIRFRGRTFTLPVVGGTDAYEGAQGSMLVEERKGRKSDLTVHLLP